MDNGLAGSLPKGPPRGATGVTSANRFRRNGSFAGAGVWINAPGSWRMIAGVVVMVNIV